MWIDQAAPHWQRRAERRVHAQHRRRVGRPCVVHRFVRRRPLLVQPSRGTSIVGSGSGSSDAGAACSALRRRQRSMTACRSARSAAKASDTTVPRLRAWESRGADQHALRDPSPSPRPSGSGGRDPARARACRSRPASAGTPASHGSARHRPARGQVADDLDLRHAVPHASPRQHLPQHHADREQIGAAIDGSRAQLLGRHVRELPLDGAGPRVVRRRRASWRCRSRPA